MWRRFFFSSRAQPPAIYPTEADLKRWACSEWVEYQAWLFHHSFVSLYQWQTLRQAALDWSNPPLISLLIPIFNTPPEYLRECIYSVQTQIYPHWEVCLVDDGSDNPATLTCLNDLVASDNRLRRRRLPHNQGICQATNQALTMARGDYIAFLDHDDRLSPDALYYVVDKIREAPETDIIYSDRDMLSPAGLRFMHLLKPGWSPETLLSGNYLFHLVVYRRGLLDGLDGVRVGFEGSQDYDLILRAADYHPQVQHLPKVLYHWRQHAQSVAQVHNVKAYAYTAGLQALQDTLARRQLTGEVSENTALWRGNYRVRLTPLSPTQYAILTLSTLVQYAEQVNQAFIQNPQVTCLIVLGPGLEPLDSAALTELTAWLQISRVGLVTGKVLDENLRILHAGLVQRRQGVPLAVYADFPEDTPGYMAVTASIRNLSTPHPACCALKRSLWQTLNGLDPTYQGPHALMDFALRALAQQMRVVYTPFARFMTREWQTPDQWPDRDRQRFVEQWLEWLIQGDPYYSPHLTLELVDMGLDTHWTVPHFCDMHQYSPTIDAP